MRILLASSSPRRKKLLKKIVAGFGVISAPPLSCQKSSGAKMITREKAQFKAVWAFLKNPTSVVIGADTLLGMGGKVFGKPKSEYETMGMIREIEGKCIDAYTSICITYAKSRDGKIEKKLWTEYAKICFKKIGDAGISRYVKSGKWAGKAGGFNIGEKPASSWIRKIAGDKNTVMGLPLKRLKSEIMAITRQAEK